MSSIKITRLSQAAGMALPGVLTVSFLWFQTWCIPVSIGTFSNSGLLKDQKTHTAGSPCHLRLEAENLKLTPDEAAKGTWA